MTNAIKWPITTYHLSKLLGLKENTIRVKKKQLEHILIEGEDFFRDYSGVKNAPPWSIFWHKRGAIKLALHSRNVKAHELLENEGILKRVKVADESKTIETICNAIKGFTEFRQQYQVGPYRIDMYLPELKIAVECDERGHSGYSKFEEDIREQFIVQKTGCRFERYDPVYPKQVGKIINIIFQAILKEQYSNKRLAIS